ncbi:hypothetical protein evm_012605 [Chilo suppressalis]|nr:hypothetical protein evm_012605 [Chilo suppressalis]
MVKERYKILQHAGTQTMMANIRETFLDCWHKKARKKGEIEHQKRLRWPIAIVTEVYACMYGYVKAAKVRTASDERVRPLQRLYPLQIHYDHNDLTARHKSTVTRSGCTTLTMVKMTSQITITITAQLPTQIIDRIDRFEKWDENEFLDRYRVSKTLARALVSHLGPLLKTRTMKNNAITPEQQVLMALEFYACGSFQRCIDDSAGVHKSSVCRIINTSCE